MSIQTYISKISDDILYRLQHLDRFTDHIFLPKTLISSFGENVDKIIYYENKVDTYELCDIINSIKKNYNKYSWVYILLLSCPEHAPKRGLKTIDID